MSELFDECESRSPSMDRIRRLVNGDPDAVKSLKNDKTLLHAACRAFDNRGGSLEVIQYLVEQWPESVKAFTSIKRYLPLHYVCKYQAPLAVIQYLVEQWPESVKHGNTDGETPLNIAAREHDAIVVINWLELPWRDRFN